MSSWTSPDNPSDENRPIPAHAHRTREQRELAEDIANFVRGQIVRSTRRRMNDEIGRWMGVGIALSDEVWPVWQEIESPSPAQTPAADASTSQPDYARAPWGILSSLVSLTPLCDQLVEKLGDAEAEMRSQHPMTTGLPTGFVVEKRTPGVELPVRFDGDLEIPTDPARVREAINIARLHYASQKRSEHTSLAEGWAQLNAMLQVWLRLCVDASAPPPPQRRSTDTPDH